MGERGGGARYLTLEGEERPGGVQARRDGVADRTQHPEAPEGRRDPVDDEDDIIILGFAEGRGGGLRPRSDISDTR